MPVPFALALIVFSLGLVGIAALHALTRRSSANGDTWKQSGFEETFDAFLAGMALVSVLLVILGIFGVFSVASVAAGVGLCGAAGWWWKSRNKESMRPSGSALRLPMGLLIVTVAAMGAFLLVRPYEAQLNNYDASLYLGAAAHLADGGGFVNDDPLVAEMTPDERRRIFAGALFRTDRAGAYYHRFPGGVQLLDPGGSEVSFNFYHLWPAWLALGLKMMGSPGFLSILSLFVAMSALSLFLLGRLVAGSVFGAVNVAVLFATFPQLHYSRMPLSELLAQAFFLAGLWCFLRALQASAVEQGKLRALAGVLWGCLCLSRADGALLLFPALCWSFLVVASLRRSLPEWLPMALPLLALTGLALLHQVAGNAYETPFVNSESIGGAVKVLARGIRDHERVLVIAWFALIVAAGVLATRSRMLAWAVALSSSSVFVLATLVWMVAFPASAQWEQVLQHLRWLALYLPNPVLPLIAVGLVILAVSASLRRSGRVVIAILIVFLAVALTSFLINPMVTPLQPWAIRRFVPMGLPLLIVCAVLGLKEGLSALTIRFGDRFRYGYLAAPAVIIAFVAFPAAVLWREPLYRDITSQLDQLASQIPANALVLMPYSMAGVAVAVNYGEGRAALLLPLEGDSEATPRSVVSAYIARQLAAGRKVVALLRQPPDPSQLLASGFDLRPSFSGAISYFDLPQVGALQFPGSTITAQVPYRVVEVYPRGTAPKVESSPDQLWRRLATGLDFTQSTLPPEVTAMAGLSHFEAAGRWTDGPVARLQFAQALPPRFSLELDISAQYARDRSVPLKVVVGDQARDLRLPEGSGTVRLDFAPTVPADAIEIRIPNPVSPKSRGESPDPRQLGIRLKSLRVLAPETVGAPQAQKASQPVAVAPAPELASGIDFSNPRLPDFVAALDGISGHEPRGRWTDAAVARVKLRQPLPRRFTLELVVADVYEPNRGQPITVRVGGEAKTFSLQRAPETVRLSFAPAQPVDTIALEIPRPTSPASRGESADPRALGIRLQALRILPPDR